MAVPQWQSATDVWIRRYHSAAAQSVRMVCFPHAGGSASYFLPVSAALSPAVEVLAVQYPGRQDRRTEPCAGSIGELADNITQALRPLAGRPLAFFGHSMGAVVAFEVARRLDQRTDQQVVVLFASGRRAPSRHRPEALHRGGDEAILAELRRLNGTDVRLTGDEELQRMILPALRADYHAIETYRCAPDARVSGPIVALVGDEDPRTTLDEADSWRRHTTGLFALHAFPGGHFYLDAQRGQVVGIISSFLATDPQVRARLGEERRDPLRLLDNHGHPAAPAG